MKKGIGFFLLVLLSALLLGCGQQAPVAAERIGELLSGLSDLPSGRLYDSTLLPHEEGNPLDADLIADLYSRADGYLEYTGRVEEAALYLSSGMDGEHLELAVFVCYGSADADAVAEMCLRRAHLVSSYTDLEPEDALVLRSGRTVYFCLGGPPMLRARLARVA